MQEQHFRKLEHLFLSAAIHQLYPGITISINETNCIITYPVHEAHFHGGNAMHGAVYFKLLDDAAYFAAAAFETGSFIVTSSFNIRLLRPVSTGVIVATGVLQKSSERVYTATSTLVNSDGKLLAEGTGSFVSTGKPLETLSGYCI
jgi:uncharacterized protein (TIGR00369 family)